MATCLYCEKILLGRKQKRFCSTSCAASYNNKIFPKRRKTKYCSECGVPVSSDQITCSKECLLIRKKRIHPEKTEEEIRNLRTLWGKRLRRNLKTKSIEYKGGKCSLCGYHKCLNALEFHHTDISKKEFTISNAAACHMDWEKVKNELDHCILVCLNCHREIHMP